MNLPMTHVPPVRDAAGGSGASVIQHWIDGAPSAAGTLQDVLDPAEGQPIRQVPLADRFIVDQAVESAAAAAPAWADTPISRRVELLRRLRELISNDCEHLIDLLGDEHGKVRADALGEFTRGLEVLDLACSAPLVLKGDYSDQVARGVDVFSMRVPLGVCVGITPFNFPAMVPLWMFPIALAAGNAFVLKPSERDPSAPARLGKLATEAGIPPGVFNVIHGDKIAVDALCDHPDVAAISFVGSTPVARYVYERGTAAGKRVQALGGAKNHMVVLPDADMDFAADAATSAAFGSSGQRCMAVSAVVAVGTAAKPLIERMQARVAEIRVGPASDPDAAMGPLVSGAARDRALAAVAGAELAGANVIADGRELTVADHEDGFFVGPTLVDGVNAEMEIYKEEIFGPVLIILRAESLADAITLVNANPYGNGAAIFTSNGAAARHFQRTAMAGMIGVNVPVPVPVASHSFGGWKQSLFGDHHLYGEEGFRFYTRGKVITSRWPESKGDGVSLAFPEV
jgi:malonate-semialdehyde dehydrogenase (acetylating)/methylmalonate-semialdehyde dehydrogenase